MSSYSGHGPRCPNHHVPLAKTNTKGIGICPVSGYRFTYTADERERKKVVKMTTAGMVEYWDWEVTTIDGDGG